MKIYMCVVCGWIYDEAAGLPDEGIAPGTLWADVPSAQAWRMGLHSQPHLAIDLPADRLRVFSPSAKEL